MSRRAQSTIVGVAILLGVTVLSLAALSAAVGTVVEEGASAAKAERAATTLDAALDPEGTGPRERRLALSGGRLRTVERSVRLVEGEEPTAEWAVDGLVYAAGERRVRHVAGATVGEASGGASLHAPPDVAARDRTLFVGVPVLDAPASLVVTGDATVELRTNVTHRRRHLSGEGFAVAVETRAPAALERHFEALGATTTRRSFDDDGVPSVVARFPEVREVYVFVHDMRLEVSGRG